MGGGSSPCFWRNRMNSEAADNEFRFGPRRRPVLCFRSIANLPASNAGSRLCGESRGEHPIRPTGE